MQAPVPQPGKIIKPDRQFAPLATRILKKYHQTQRLPV
jgi:hypothetical protein